MHRRTFLSGGALAATYAAAQNLPVREEAVEKDTPAATPAIVLSQVGFLPGARKR